jgi:hypothetical protein
MKEAEEHNKKLKKMFHKKIRNSKSFATDG